MLDDLSYGLKRSKVKGGRAFKNVGE